MEKTDYKEIRHSLHEHPQTAGNEQYAHDTVIRHLQSLHPDHVYTHVGGYGVIAVWGKEPNAPTVAFRADTDALPIGHRCGHDGHTTILLRLAELIDSEELRMKNDESATAAIDSSFFTLHSSFNYLLLWQPAEETGTGSRAVIESGILQQYNIKAFYALHNIPGYPLGTVVVCPNTFAAASTGVVYRLDGRETHASTPELGINPGPAVADIIRKLQGFNHVEGRFQQSTLICVRLGSPAFGTSAGSAEVMYTMRAFTNANMERLLADSTRVVGWLAKRYRLEVTRSLVEPFHATENRAEGVRAVEQAAAALHYAVAVRDMPFRWSEDFAEYLMLWPGAMFGIGSGEQQPELHHPSYDFPDSLIEPAARLFFRLATF